MWAYDKTMKMHKLVIVALCGIIAGLLAGRWFPWHAALLAGWDAALLAYIGWTWRAVYPMNGRATQQHALREDPSRPVADAVILGTVLGSLGAVGFMLVASSASQGLHLAIEAIFVIISIVIAWAALHTLFILHYAEQYYIAPVGGVDFGETTTPCYRDFAYLAFTIGMTFQVSDTQLSAQRMRRTALRHAVLSYAFGTIIVAATVNLVASLGK